MHVWRIDLGEAAAKAAALRGLLSPDEEVRAKRFHFDKHRDAFIGARATLRQILARYAARSAKALSFTYTEYGKPFLSPECAGPTIRFNLSHAHERALLAVTDGREIGADVEWIRADFTGDEIAERFFSIHERDVLRGLPREARDLSFFQCWTRKEAYIKAAGPGMSIPLHSFDVSLGPGVAAELLATRPETEEAAHWSMSGLDPGPGYAGAVAVEGRDYAIATWDWDVSAAVASASRAR